MASNSRCYPLRTRLATISTSVRIGLKVKRATGLSVAVAVLSGCGGSGKSADQTKPPGTSSRSVPIGTGSKTVTCHSIVFIGSGRPDWRRLSYVAGPFGLARSAADLGKRQKDGLFHTKDPVIVKRGRRAELWVPRAERHRVAITVADPDPRAGPSSRVVFVPCDSKPRTVWPAGLVLRDRAPITMQVRVGDSVRTLRIRPIGGEPVSLPSQFGSSRPPRAVINSTPAPAHSLLVALPPEFLQQDDERQF